MDNNIRCFFGLLLFVGFYGFDFFLFVGFYGFDFFFFVGNYFILVLN